MASLYWRGKAFGKRENMSNFTERPGDMRPRDRDGFDFGRQQAQPARPQAAGRRRGAPADSGTVALALGMVQLYWMMPLLMGRRRRRRNAEVDRPEQQ